MSAEGTLTLPGRSILLISSVLLSALTVLDPFGAVGLPLAVLAAGMLTVLSLRAGRSIPRALVVYISAPAALVAAVWMLVALRELPTETALISALPALWPAAMALPIWLAIASAALWGVYFALSIQAAYGALDLETVKAVLDEAFIPIKSALASLTLDKDGTNIQLYADADIDAMIESAKTVLLGASGALLITASYLATLAARIIAGCFDLTERLPASMRIRMRAVPGEDGPTVELSHERVVWRIELDLISAIMLIAAYFLSLLLPAGTPAELTASNLMLLLMPGFVYAGVREIFGTGSGPARGCSGVIFAGALVLLNPVTLAMLLTVTGILSVIRENRNRSRAEKLAQDLGEAARRNDSAPKPPSDSGSSGDSPE